MSNIAGKATTGDGQLALIGICIARAVIDGPVRFGNKGAAVDGGNIMILECGLSVVGASAVVKDQFAVVIVLDGVDTTNKRTAVHGKKCILIVVSGVIRQVISILPTVCNQTGMTAHGITIVVRQSRGDSGTCIDGHGAVILHGIPRVSVGQIRLISTGLLAAGERTAVQGCDSADLVDECAFAVRDIVDRAAAGNSQIAVIGNGVTADVGQIVTVQVEGNGSVCGDNNILLRVSRQLDGDIRAGSEIVQSAQIGESTARNGNIALNACNFAVLNEHLNRFGIGTN